MKFETWERGYDGSHVSSQKLIMLPSITIHFRNQTTYAITFMMSLQIMEPIEEVSVKETCSTKFESRYLGLKAFL